MASIVGVQFQKNGKVTPFNDNQIDLKPGDYVVADTAHGMDLGQVVTGPVQQPDSELNDSQRKIIRLATEKDLQTGSENREKEREAFAICQKKITEHQLDMKLVSVEYAFDGNKALFYFTANGRVDFRSLVKDLASVFKMRIELRQIGVRDEARMIGGLGPCGRQICCGSFLDEFQPVSIKMAKEQNLSLNPAKISGVCGRLMCCLKYEQDFYEATRKMMPRVGREVMTPDGNGTVSDLNIVKETVFVRIMNGDTSEIKEYPLDQIKRPGAAAPVPADEPSEEAEDADNPLPEPATENEPDLAETAGQDSDSIPQPAAGSQQPSGGKRRPPENRKNRPDGEQQRTGRNNRGGNSENGGKNRESRKQPRGEQTRNNPALGKPVMRENPNRNNTGQAPSAASKPAEKKAKPASSWAEAVQKAMDNIE